MAFLEKKIIKFVWQHKRPHPSSQSDLEKENGTGGIRRPDFRLYCKATVIKQIKIWHLYTKTEISIGQDRKPRNKVMHLWLPNLLQRRQDYIMEKRQSLQ